MWQRCDRDCVLPSLPQLWRSWYSWDESCFPECEPFFLLLPFEANFKELIDLTVRPWWGLLFAKRGNRFSYFPLTDSNGTRKNSRCLVTDTLAILYAPCFCRFLLWACGEIIANWMGLCTGVWKWTLGSVVLDWQISSNWINVKVKTNKWWRCESPGVVSVSNRIKGCSVVKCFRGTMWN